MSLRISLLPLLIFAAIPIAFPSDSEGTETATGRPNILLLLADNWAWPHASAYGDRSVRTPTFDRVARNGALMTHAFCQVPSCSPARAVLLTGQASHRLEDAASLWGIFPDHLPVYPQILEAEGYSTGYSLKGWGPGYYRGRRHTASNPAGTQYSSFKQFLSSVPKDRPFCFWFGSHDPHQPWNRGDDFRGDLDPSKVEVPPYVPDHPVVRNTIADYYAEVQRFDHECGEILKILEASGQLANTLVIMVGDNGWQMPRGLANVYDMGTRVSMAVQWPTKFDGGQRVDDFISFEDFAPTLLDAAGLKPREVMTGKSFLPLLHNQNNEDVTWRDAIFLERERHANVRAQDRSYPCRAIRTKRFLYVRNLMPELWPAGDPERHWAVGPFGDVDGTAVKELILSHKDEPQMQPYFTLGFDKRPAEELYDLAADPHQMKNVADDPAYHEQKRKLSKRVDTWMKETDDPRAISPTDPRFDRYAYYGNVPKEYRTQTVGQPKTVRGGAIKIALDAPASNYGIAIEEVYDVGHEMWAISRITKSGDFGAAAITKIRDDIPLVLASNRSIKHKVAGKTWNWGQNTEEIEYIDNIKSILSEIEKRNGRLIWRRVSNP